MCFGADLKAAVATWDGFERVSLRSAFVASAFAARMTVPAATGMIVDASSLAAQRLGVVR